MKKILILALGLLLIYPQLASAQSQRNPCIYLTTTNNNCQPVGSSTNGVGNSPMPVGGIASAAAKTFIEGMVGGLSFDLSGNLRVIGSGSTTVAGNVSNASSAVPTSSTNVPTVSYNYGFNGTTWDQLQVDSSKFLKINATNFPATVSVGTGAQGASSPRVTVATDQASNAGAALVKGGVGVVNGGSTYQAVAASQTATVLQSSTGAIGDYLSHCVIYPTTTTPGVVTVFDNTNAAASSAIIFPGGASSVSNLAPIAIPVGALSTAGAWKVTTGTNVSVVCFGKFS